MLCADELCVEEFQISKRFDICRYLISVTSAYLNRSSDIERQKLGFPKTEAEADMVSLISREKLMPRIREECLAMINEAAEGDIDAFKLANSTSLNDTIPSSRWNRRAAMPRCWTLTRSLNLPSAAGAAETRSWRQWRRGVQVAFDDISHLASDDLARFIVHRALVSIR